MRPGSAPAPRKRGGPGQAQQNPIDPDTHASPSHRPTKQISLGNLHYFLNENNFQKKVSKSSREMNENEESLGDISSKPSSKTPSSRPDFDLLRQSQYHRISKVQNLNPKPQKVNLFFSSPPFTISSHHSTSSRVS
jgi:hypothetical protein